MQLVIEVLGEVEIGLMDGRTIFYVSSLMMVVSILRRQILLFQIKQNKLE